MDAADAQNGRQSLYIKEGGHAEYDGGIIAEAAAISSVTVKNGTLDFATYDGMVNGNLEISGSGGRLEISSMIAGGTGLLAFETATFDRGTIEFTITELSADKIEISGALTKSGLGEINVEFDADTYDIREWISASGGDSIEYELITFGSTNMKESDFIAEDLGDGIFANLFIRGQCTCSRVHNRSRARAYCCGFRSCRLRACRRAPPQEIRYFAMLV